jgi:hypothetical protein
MNIINSRLEFRASIALPKDEVQLWLVDLDAVRTAERWGRASSGAWGSVATPSPRLQARKRPSRWMLPHWHLALHRTSCPLLTRRLESIFNLALQLVLLRHARCARTLRIRAAVRSLRTTRRLLILEVNSRAAARRSARGVWSFLHCARGAALRSWSLDILLLQVNEFRGRVRTIFRRVRRNRRLSVGWHCGFRSQWLGRTVQRIRNCLGGR